MGEDKSQLKGKGLILHHPKPGLGCSVWCKRSQAAACEGMGRAGRSWTTPGDLLGSSDLSRRVTDCVPELCAPCKTSVLYLLGRSNAEMRDSRIPSATSSTTGMSMKFSQLCVYRCLSLYYTTLHI